MGLLNLQGLLEEIKQLNDKDKIDALNLVRRELHSISPFINEPVDCVQWIIADDVFANDYNPNSVAPPEMKLLQLSIREDGYTQPIVAHGNVSHSEVIDGFHRHRVGQECDDIKKRIHGYLPIVLINHDREDKADRMASTIRHNRARGKHSVDGMSAIIQDLTKRNWSEEKIAKELGMEPDEVLRLKQITGLAEMFADKEFSEAWEI